MNYKRVVTERAEEQLDRILRYLLERFHSKQAARALMEDVERTYVILEYMAGAVQLCEDPFLAGKGYRKSALEQHDYVILYQLEADTVYINGIFHMLENYQKKL